MEGSTVVIKVKYGDTLRRFSARVINYEMNLNMSQLTEKICSLFHFDSDVGIMLTYVDEDGDLVALVDDNDLRDVVKQSLNPLRITVKLSIEKSGTPLTRTTGSSPALSPRMQLPFQNSNAVASEILKTISDPLREAYVNLSSDLASKVSSSAQGISPGVTELVNYFSNVGLSYLIQLSQSQTSSRQSSQSGYNESSISSHETDGPNLSRVDPSTFKVPAISKSRQQECKNDEIPLEHKLSAVTEDLKVNFGSVTGGSMEASSSKGNSNPIKGYSPDGRTTCVSNVPENSTSSKTPMISNSCDLSYGRSVFAKSSTFDCPFSGPNVENISASGTAQPASEVVQFSRSRSQNDGSGTDVHRGIRCDGCGMYPIVGPRFKSLIKVNYDLCGVCFPKLGSESDYFRIGHHPVMRIPFYPYMHPMFQKVCGDSKSKQVAFKLNSQFIKDVNVLDGTAMAPLTPFTKIWRMRNNGRFPWPEKTQLVWIGGDKMSNSYSFQVEVPATGLSVGQELEIAADFISPELPGRYISYWRMTTPSGRRFGQRVWVLIQVETTYNATQSTGDQGLNLNLPLVNSVLTDIETINVDLTDSDNSHAKKGKIDPELHGQQPTIEQEMKFPITDSLLVGSSSTSSAPLVSPSYTFPLVGGETISAPVAPPSYLYPLVDLSDMASATLPSLSTLNPLPPPVGSTIAHTNEPSEKEEVEKKLLRELEEMGFKQTALNKEILKMHEYDLKQAVADLCGLAEWDPILEELQEMGFHDTEMNKKLLKKNNGSIKRVVMDLIAGEEV